MPDKVEAQIARTLMRWKFAAVVAAAAVAVSAFAVSAEEASKKRITVYRSGPSGDPGTVFITRDEDGRTRTRVIAQRRSYLDAGTEVTTGQRKYNDYATTPFWSPIDILGPGKNYDRMPL